MYPRMFVSVGQEGQMVANQTPAVVVQNPSTSNDNIGSFFRNIARRFDFIEQRPFFPYYYYPYYQYQYPIYQMPYYVQPNPSLTYQQNSYPQGYSCGQAARSASPEWNAGFAAGFNSR